MTSPVTTQSPVARALPQLIVGATALLVGLGVLTVMLWHGEMLVRLGLVGHLWYVLLLLLGFAAAACLFALFKSYARYSGKAMNGRLELGGPAVLMLVVIVLGFQLVPAPAAAFALTVFVHGEAGRQAQVLRNRGRLFLDLGADRRSEAIGDKGEVRFVGIPADQRGRTVPVSLEAEGYELVRNDAQVKLDTDATYVAVRAKMLHLRGEVFDAGGRPLPGARFRIADRTGITRADGSFDLPLPADLPESDRVMTITAPDHAPWRGQVVPGGNPLVVHLNAAR